MAGLTTHVLDLTSGKPAEGLKICLFKKDSENAKNLLGNFVTNSDGRISQSLLNEKEVGVVVIDNSDLLQLPERLRVQLSESITPTVLGIGTEEDNTLRESIKSALGVDLWK